MIHAFISSRLDDCNLLYFGLPVSALHRLQLVPNPLHCLQIQYRIEFKSVLFVYYALNNLALQYLSELIIAHNPARSLRSQTSLMLQVPRSRLRGTDDRAFSVAGLGL